MFLRFCGGDAVPLLQAPPLDGDVAGDEDHRTKPGVQITFEQERDFVDDNVVPGRGMFADFFFRQSTHARVDDRLEFFSRFGVAENNLSKLCPVKSVVRLQDIRAEAGHDFFPSILVRLNDFARKHVSVDDGRAEIFEHFCHGALAGSDAACEADQFHATVMAK